MAITVDTFTHDSAKDKLNGTEASDAGILAKDISAHLSDGDTIISISHCYLQLLNQVLTTVVKDSD